MANAIEREHFGGDKYADPFAAAVHATRMPMLITDPRRADNPVLYCNDAFLALTGYERSEVLGRNCRFLQGAATNMDDVAKVRDAVERRVGIEIDLLNYRKDGSTFWNRLLISPVFDENQQLLFFFASQFDVTPERNRFLRIREDRESLEREIEQRVSDLGRSEERLRFAMRAGRLGAWTLDALSRRLVVSVVFKEIFGFDAADTFTLQDLTKAIHPSDAEVFHRELDRVLSQGGEFNLDCRLRRSSGELRWMQIRGEATLDSEGRPLSVAGIASDMTERKQAEEHRDLLIHELNHRVKNTLATVQSICSQSIRSANHLEEALGVVTQRLQALARAHDVLANDAWVGAQISEIVGKALEPFWQKAEERVVFAGPDFELGPKRATALTLALHELATNATKYGALSNQDGRVLVTWERDGHSFRLTWREEGGPPVSEPSQRGFGSRLIERTIAAEFGGNSRIEYRPEGVLFELMSDNAFEPE